MSDGHDSASAALSSALAILARRDHSEQELRQKLSVKGYSPATVAAVIDRLRELNYLDDRRFAETWCAGAMGSRRFFGPRLRMELVRRGVSRELAAEVTAGAMADCEETELLAALLSRKFPGFNGAAAPAGEQRRVVAYLQRRGYSLSAILQVVKGIDG